METQSEEQQRLFYETKLKEVIDHFTEILIVEETFSVFAVIKPEEEKAKNEAKLNKFVTFWQSCPQKFQESCMKVMVEQTKVAPSTLLRHKMFLVLKMLVDRNAVTAKLVCDALVSSEHVIYENREMWIGGLQLVKKIISGIDYKGCRDILHQLLGKIQKIPERDNIGCMPYLEVLYDLVKTILDRDVCLLPAYFAVNEIVKFYYDDKSRPHYSAVGQLLSEFIESFKPTAQMVSIIGRSKLLPIVGHSNQNSNVWKISSNTLKFFLNGPLPYEKELTEPQDKLLSYVIEQPYSREVACAMLALSKQQKTKCAALEEQFVNLMIKAMENSSENDDDADEEGNDMSSRSSNRYLWDHLSCQIIFFVLFQFTSFSHIVSSICSKLKAKNLRKGRDNLMWLLLQFISGSIQKNALEEFLPVLELYDYLYPEQEPLPNPDVEKKSCTRKMAVTCIWVHLLKKAQNDKVILRNPFPAALSSHMEFLQQLSAVQSVTLTDYKIALLSNAYSTNSELFSQRMSSLIEMVYGVPHKSTLLPGDVPAFAPTQPLDIKMLDSLTVHAKMSVIHSIVTRIMKLAQNKQNALALSPSVVETYSRLLVYTEIESLGIKGFVGQLLISVFKDKCWGILYTLIELASYRLHHVQPHYRIQLFSQLHTIMQMKHANIYQLHLCLENAALHLITGLANTDIQFQLSRAINEQKLPTIFSPDSEELNKVLVLTLARSMHITGSETLTSNWCKDILTSINQLTPHSWSSHTLATFPPAICEFYAQNPVQREDKATLKRNVESEYRKWKSMAGENDLVNHFSSEGSQPLFICVLWKCLLEDNRIMPIAYKVLDILGPRALGVQLRYFVEYMVIEVSNYGANNPVLKYVESVSDLIWKWNVAPLDRLILCMLLRSFEANEAQVCHYVIQVLLLRSHDFRNRVVDFVKDNSPEHWLVNNWYEKHMDFHKKYPEKFFFENVAEIAHLPHNQYLPIHFSNVCLRFLPVFDILIHRFLESPVVKSLESILDHLGVLYKFHSRPLTFLYNTLHYYEKLLADKPNLKRKLVGSIAGSLKDIKPVNWCLSNDYLQYLPKPSEKQSEECDWDPDVDYYIRLIGKIISTIEGKPMFPSTDWRFGEFPNASTHILCITAIELMALPKTGNQVGRALYELILNHCGRLPRKQIFSWINAIGIVLTSLPESYWSVLNELVVEVLTDDMPRLQPPIHNIFHILNFSAAHRRGGEMRCSLLLALCHSVWVHSSIGQLNQLAVFMKDNWKPVIKTESQFIYVCHLVGPSLQRLFLERTRCMLEIAVELYEMLDRVDKSVERLNYLDPITDFLYHVKYMFVGDGVKSDVERIIRNLRPELQFRLKYISNQNKDDQQAQQQQASTSSTTFPLAPVNPSNFFISSVN